jgi:soluble lytic murein transglycosylase-like protein
VSVSLIGARIAEIQQQLSAVVTGQAPSTASASFADQLASAQSATGTTATTAATPTTLGGGTATQYDAQITAAATKYGIDPALLKGLIRQESNFHPSAQSGAGAQGLTQLMPGTASSLGVTDPTDPAQAIDGGAKYLSQQLQRFGGDASKALAAYNAGPGAVTKYGGVPPYAETQGYVQKVLGYAAEYRGTAATATTAAAAVPATTTPVSPASLLSSIDASDDGASSASTSGTLSYSTV